MAEWFFGAARSGSGRNLTALANFLEPLEIAGFDHSAAATHRPLRAALASAGKPIGPLDTQIAAHALALDVILVSNTRRAFSRVPGLKLDNWVGPG